MEQKLQICFKLSLESEVQWLQKPHRAQVSPDLDLGFKKVFHSYQLWGALQLLFHKVSTKMHFWGSRTPPCPFGPRGQGSGCPTLPITLSMVHTNLISLIYQTKSNGILFSSIHINWCQIEISEYFNFVNKKTLFVFFLLKVMVLTRWLSRTETEYTH